MANSPMPTAPSKNQQWEAGRKAGVLIGRQEIRKQVLDFLQRKYMDRNVSTDSQYSKEILELTMELSKMMKVG